MKKICSIFLFLLLITFSIGCSSDNKINTSMIASPKNNKLDIIGEWACSDYKILDKNIASNEAIFDIFAKNVRILSSALEIDDICYNNVEYRLKLVKPDYALSYEVEDTIKDLGITGDRIRVYSIIYKNNLLCEFIYDSKELSYIYYQGILFYLNYEKAIDKNKEKVTTKEEDKIDNNSQNKSSQGLLLGLKVKEKNKVSVEYKTIWISTKEGEVSDIRSKNKLILPRRNGIWEVEQKAYTDMNKNIYYEYLDVKPLDKENQISTANFDKISEGKILKEEINYISNDYVSLEIQNNERFSQSPVYRFIPIDNTTTNESIVIDDFFGEKDKESFEESYEKAYYSITNEDKTKLAKNINYSNFTMVREEGKWVLKGRISPIVSGILPIDFNLDFKPNKNICSYNILTVPWRALKSEVPFLVDAFTSPDGSLVVIMTKEELLIYTAKGGKLSDEPCKKIKLEGDESVVMTEWCENDYVYKWTTAFNKGSSIIG